MKQFPTEFSKCFRLPRGYLPIFMLAFMLLLGMAVALCAQPTWTTIDYPGGFNTNAFGINNRGDIVGRWEDANGDTHGFLLRDGVFTQIDVPEALLTTCLNINNHGDIGGRYVDSAFMSHGYMLKKGTFTTIDPPDSVDTRLRGINDLGDLTGRFTDANGDTHGFLFHHGNFTQFNVEGADNYTEAFQINNSGVIVGDYINDNDPNGIFHAFKRVRGVIIPIDDFPSATTGTSAEGINSQGDIVGPWAGDDGNFHGFLLTKKGFQDIEFPDSIATSPMAINSQGTIVGWYTDADGNDHGFVRTPDSMSGQPPESTTGTISGMILTTERSPYGPRDGHANVSFTTPEGAMLQPTVFTDTRGFYKQTGFPINTTVVVTADDGCSNVQSKTVVVRRNGVRVNFLLRFIDC